MKFATNYNLTERMKRLIKEGKLFSYENTSYERVYAFNDTHRIMLMRIQEGYNADYERKDGIFLVEEEHIDKYDLVNFIVEKEVEEFNTKHADEEEKMEAELVTDRATRDLILDTHETGDILDYILMFDDEQGLENYDVHEEYSLEDAIKTINGGYGIIEGE